MEPTARLWLGSLDPRWMSFSQAEYDDPLLRAKAICRCAEKIAQRIEILQAEGWEVMIDGSEADAVATAGRASWEQAAAELSRLGMDGCTLDWFEHEDESDLVAGWVGQLKPEG
jgi:hypothetical protein